MTICIDCGKNFTPLTGSARRCKVCSWITQGATTAPDDAEALRARIRELELSNDQLQRDKTRLELRNALLEFQVATRDSPRSTGRQPWLPKELRRRILMLIHPDRHNGSALSTEVTAALNAMPD